LYVEWKALEHDIYSNNAIATDCFLKNFIEDGVRSGILRLHHSVGNALSVYVVGVGIGGHDRLAWS
jgi:hypothetical protein